jgi:hypothetical protein
LCEQRQRFRRLEVARDPLGQSRVDVQAGDRRRSLDQALDPFERHQRQRVALGHARQLAGLDQAVEHVRAAGRDHQ